MKSRCGGQSGGHQDGEQACHVCGDVVYHEWVGVGGQGSHTCSFAHAFLPGDVLSSPMETH